MGYYLTRTMLLVTAVLNFFFSSRRRHTRYIGDWSSDVCSSDLLHPVREVLQLAAAAVVADLDVELAVGAEEDLAGVVVAPHRLSLVALGEIGRASCRERVERLGLAATVELE